MNIVEQVVKLCCGLNWLLIGPIFWSNARGG